MQYNTEVYGVVRVCYATVQVLVELAQLQDREVGDGTTSVVIIAAELLRVRRRPAFLAMCICCIVHWTLGVEHCKPRLLWIDCRCLHRQGSLAVSMLCSRMRLPTREQKKKRRKKEKEVCTVECVYRREPTTWSGTRSIPRPSSAGTG